MPQQTQGIFRVHWCLHPEAFCPAGVKGQEIGEEISLDGMYSEGVSDVYEL